MSREDGRSISLRGKGRMFWYLRDYKIKTLLTYWRRKSKTENQRFGSKLLRGLRVEKVFSLKVLITEMIYKNFQTKPQFSYL